MYGILARRTLGIQVLVSACLFDQSQYYSGWQSVYKNSNGIMCFCIIYGIVKEKWRTQHTRIVSYTYNDLGFSQIAIICIDQVPEI